MPHDPDNPLSLAACLGAQIDLFFPNFEAPVLDADGNETGEYIEFYDDGTVFEQYGDTTEFYEEGREICMSCPIREECLEGAMLRRERYGLFGGLVPIERRRIERRERRRRLQERRRREAAGEILLPDIDDDPELD